MANRYPGQVDLAHSDVEAPRSRCSSRSDRESDSDANRARREQASDAARWSRGRLWVNVALNVLLCECIEATHTYSDDRDFSGCPVPLTRPTPGCPRRVERRARYAAHAGGLLAGAVLGYFL